MCFQELKLDARCALNFFAAVPPHPFLSRTDVKQVAVIVPEPVRDLGHPNGFVALANSSLYYIKETVPNAVTLPANKYQTMVQNAKSLNLKSCSGLHVDSVLEMILMKQIQVLGSPQNYP